MQFIDLSAQQQRIREKIETGIQAVLNHGSYIMGPEVSQLEECIGNYIKTRHAVSCSSGTDALLLALMAFKIGPGDAVFTSPFTFIATAEVISILGATPVFVDIDPETYNIDPEKLRRTLADFNKNLTPKGIISVDLFGLPADYDAVNAIAKEHNLFVIEDAAQSFGAEYKNRKACSLADIACTSFFPAKPLGAYGDGGMCFTDDDNLAEIMRSLRIHGKGNDKYDNIRIGVNGRLDTIQAAVLLAKFDIFPEEIEMRREAAGRYASYLADTSLVLPHVPSYMKSVWAQYSILAENEKQRSMLQEKLKNEGVPTAIYYPKPLHLQTAFSFLNYKPGDFPVSESISGRIFSIPMHPYLKAQDQERISDIILNFL